MPHDHLKRLQGPAFEDAVTQDLTQLKIDVWRLWQRVNQAHGEENGIPPNVFYDFDADGPLEPPPEEEGNGPWICAVATATVAVASSTSIAWEDLTVVRPSGFDTAELTDALNPTDKNIDVDTLCTVWTVDNGGQWYITPLTCPAPAA